MPYPPQGAPVLTAEDVWTYAARILTNLLDPRAARIDNLDALLSSRLSEAGFDTRLPEGRAKLIDSLGTPDDFKADVSALLTQAVFLAQMEVIKSRAGASYERGVDSLEAAGDEYHHVTQLFPEGSDETLTFTSGPVDNVFGAWAEVIDSSANKLEDKIIRPAQITAFMVETATVKDEVYVFQVAYGDAKTIVAPYRFIAGETIKLISIQQIRVRSKLIPPGEKVYYRMKCETGGCSCELHMRYYLHRA